MGQLADEMNETVALLAPQTKLPAIMIKAAAGLIVAVLAGWVIWKLFFAEHAAQVEHDKAAAHAQANVGNAQGDAGAKAANTVANNADKETKTHEITRDHYYEITKQPGAGDPVSDAVDAAGRRSICVRFSAASLPDCNRLSEANP